MGDPTTPNLTDSPPRSVDISYQLGYLQATCDQILAELRSRNLTHSPTYGLTIFRRLREAYDHFERFHKIVSVMRAVRWGSLGWTVYGSLRWLGLM